MKLMPYYLITRIARGLFKAEYLGFSAAGIAGVMIGLYFGGKVFEKLDTARIKLATYILVFVSGVITVIQSL